MAAKTPDYSLLDGFVRVLRLPWIWTTAIIAGILLAALIFAAHMQGYFADGIDWTVWRLGLQPAIIVYIFLVVPLTRRLWERAIQSMATLLPEPETVQKIGTFNRRGEWSALLLGVLFPVVLMRPWTISMKWSDFYILSMSIIMFGLLGLIIYGGLADTIRLARLGRRKMQLDIFDNEALVPVSRWGLSISLAFVGGISLSLVFQPVKNLQNINSVIVYSILASVTVLLFFTSIWSVHDAMALAKKRELAVVRENLGKARQELRQQVAQGTLDGRDRLYSAVAVWGIYERQVLEASTWPFNAGIIRRLAASTIAPAIVYVIKILAVPGMRF